MTYRGTVRLPHHLRRPARPARLALAAGLASYAVAVSPVTPDAAAAGSVQAERPIAFQQWDTTAQLQQGRTSGVAYSNGRAVFSKGTTSLTVGGTRYDAATWESPWSTPGFGFTQLIPSWSASTPGDSLVEIRVRGRDSAGTLSSWDLLGRWAATDAHTERTTSSGQSDDLGKVDVDTWKTVRNLKSWQVRVVLARRAGTTARPSFDAVGAVASRLPTTTPKVSEPGSGAGVVLDVPRYSQMVHKGHYPQWGNGGEAWCSPTSTSMVLGYYGRLPKASSYSWVPKGHTDPWVDYAARMTYDHDYDGTGNWPFNTAYAAPLAGKAFVTRLRSLREAERFIKAGIPLVASVTFGKGELDGAPISSTAGHLLVIAGFTKSGDVVVNDPASSTRSGVRRTYDRAQFERAWLPRSGGLVYVIRDSAHPLPSGSLGNW